jgi:fructose-bisphosphate aldolase class I
LNEYARLGARFSKWRAVLTMGAHLPTRTCLEANVHALARFAALSQEAGLVPIVEPEVLMDGDHDLARHYDVTESALHALFHGLFEQRVRLEALLLKVNMVLSGTTCTQQVVVEQAVEATSRCMQRTVPVAVPGIVFLSGGQAEVRATEHLDGLNRIGRTPWQMSFSFGRALQAPALKTWSGVASNMAAAQQALLRRASCNSAARFGQYTAEMERKSPRMHPPKSTRVWPTRSTIADLSANTPGEKSRPMWCENSCWPRSRRPAR